MALATSRGSGPVAVLRGHEAEVHALCYVPLDSTTNVIVSGSVDGMLYVWHALHHSLLLSWTAHTGGVLAVAASPAPAASGSAGETRAAVGSFWSQGRDGCIHQWQWPSSTPAHSAAAATDDADEVLAMLADVLAPPGTQTASASRQPGLQLPVKVRTIRVGYGTFCRFSLFRQASPAAAHMRAATATAAAAAARHKPTLSKVDLLREEEKEQEAEGKDESGELTSDAMTALWLVAPSLDSAKLELWLCPDGPGPGSDSSPSLQRVIAVPTAAAVAVARALGRVPQPHEVSGNSSISDMMSQTGMAMHCSAIAPPPWLQSSDSAGTAAAAAATTTTAAADAAVLHAEGQQLQEYVNADGSPKHPDAESLRELLLRGGASAAPATRSAGASTEAGHAVPPGPLPPWVAACYENGALYILDPLFKPSGAIAAGSGSAHASRGHELLHSSSGTEQPAAAHTVLVLPVCKEPLLTFALSSDARTAVCGSAGSVLYVARLSLPTTRYPPATTSGSGCGSGSVLRRIPLAAPGISAALAWHGSGVSGVELALTGGWDGTVRAVPLSQEGAQEECSSSDSRCPAVLNWHGSSVYALAVDDISPCEWVAGPAAVRYPLLRLATAAKDGRIAVWRLAVNAEMVTS